MRRDIARLLVLVAVIGVATSAAAAEVREVGLRIDLTLQPVYAGGEIRWNFELGGYALLSLGSEWAVRASAGFNVLSVGPYVGVGLLRAVATGLAVEGDALLQWTFGSAAPVATVGVGARMAGGTAGLRYQFAVFPVSWTLASVAGAPAVFSFSPSLTLGAGFMLETGLEFGQAVTAKFLRIPSGARPVLPVGGWMLSTRLTSHLGFVVAAGP